MREREREAHEEKCLGAGRPKEGEGKGKMGGEWARHYKLLKYCSHFPLGATG